VEVIYGRWNDVYDPILSDCCTLKFDAFCSRSNGDSVSTHTLGLIRASGS
jgi:hypothetical protein